MKLTGQARLTMDCTVWRRFFVKMKEEIPVSGKGSNCTLAAGFGQAD